MEVGKVEAERFGFLERHLMWRGWVRRADLRRRFDLSESGANQIFRAYNALRPQAMTLDRSLKAYVPAPGFVPVFYQPVVADCELTTVGTGLRVDVGAAVLVTLATALRESRVMQIEYTALDQTRSTRDIYPLAFIRMLDGFPPALHAWCYLKNAPRTFQLANITRAVAGRIETAPPTSAELKIGTIDFDGIQLQIPRSAIFAVAGQCFGVPELRNTEALESVKQLATALADHWIPLDH